MHELLHWTYVLAMAAGVLLFLFWSTQPRGVPRYEYLIALMIPVWSGLVYTAMALGEGMAVVDGQTAYWARYLDWVVTTPLLLTALALTAMVTVPKKLTLIGALIATDIVMILCGLVADVTEGATRWVFFLSGCVAFAFLIYLIWVPLRAVAQSQDARVASLYDKMAAMLTVLWVFYPSVWLLGPSGLGVIGQDADTFMFVVVPIVSKVGFSIADLIGLRNLAASGIEFYNEHERLESIEADARQ